MPHEEVDHVDPSSVLNVFRNVKDATDDIILKYDMDTYCEEYLPRTEELTIAIISRALEILGCQVISSSPGTELTPVRYLPQHARLVEWIYQVLEKQHLLERKGEVELVRTSVAYTYTDIETLLEDLLDDRPGQKYELQIMGIVGSAYADSISGKTDAVELLFGNDRGRALLADFYSKSDLFSIALDQMSVFLELFAANWPKDSGPLRILEVGAGTGGSTWRLLAVLKRLGIPFVYTMTDIGSAFGAAAREKLDTYAGAVFEVLDIEKEPRPELHQSQHMVFGSNVFHATRNLHASLSNVRKLLKPDGFVVLHELTQQMLWGDMSFGLFPGWWAFEDGRQNAIQAAPEWATVLRSVGFDHVDWTQGQRAEANIQALILGMAPAYRKDCMDV